MKNEKRKTPTNRYYELKKNNKEKRLSSVQLLLLSSLLLLLSQILGGVEDVNNVKRKLVQYIHQAYTDRVFQANFHTALPDASSLDVFANFLDEI